MGSSWGSNKGVSHIMGVPSLLDHQFRWAEGSRTSSLVARHLSGMIETLGLIPSWVGIFLLSHLIYKFVITQNVYHYIHFFSCYIQDIVFNRFYETMKKKCKYICTKYDTGGSRLSRTAVKPDSRLARIFVAKFLCIIKLIVIMRLKRDTPVYIFTTFRKEYYKVPLSTYKCNL